MNSNQDYFEDHFDEIAEDYWNSDASGDLSLIGEFVLNNPKCLTAFLEAWSMLPENERAVREWFASQGPDGPEREQYEER